MTHLWGMKVWPRAWGAQDPWIWTPPAPGRGASTGGGGHLLAQAGQPSPHPPAGSGPVLGPLVSSQEQRACMGMGRSQGCHSWGR
jgi:hypothetical protein